MWLGSDSGRQWLAGTVAGFSDGAVGIRGLSGQPLSQTKALSILFTGNGVTVTAEGVSLVWSPWRLLAGELHIAQLYADRVQVRTVAAPAGPAKSGSGMPLSVLRLDSMQIGELVIEPQGGQVTRISAIRLTGLQLGEAVAGHLQAQGQGGTLAATLTGSKADWHVHGSAQSKVGGKLAFALSGRDLHAGKAEVGFSSDSGKARLEGHWQRSKESVIATGQLHLQRDSNAMEGDWKLETASDFSHADLSMQAKASNPGLLGRTMPFAISATWNQGVASAVVTEAEHGLKLLLGYAGDELQGDLTLAGWDSPLKKAAGRLNGHLHGTLQPGKNIWQLQGDIDKSELAGLTASMQVDGEGDGGHWQLRRADVQLLGLDMKLTGKGDKDQFRLAGSLQGKDIAPLLKLVGIKQAAGRVQADATLAGSYAAPQAKLTAQLKVNGSLKSGRLSLKLSSEGPLQSRAQMLAEIADPAHRKMTLTGVSVHYNNVSLLEAERLVFSVDGKRVQLPASAIRLLGAQKGVAPSTSRLSGSGARWRLRTSE